MTIALSANTLLNRVIIVSEKYPNSYKWIVEYDYERTMSNEEKTKIREDKNKLENTIRHIENKISLIDKEIETIQHIKSQKRIIIVFLHR